MKIKCEHCGTDNVFPLEDLRGMPLKNKHGQIVATPPVDVSTGTIIVECDSCHKPMVHNCG